MFSKEVMTNYVKAIQKQYELTNAIEGALRKIDSDNQLMGLVSGELSSAVDQMLLEVMGAEKFDWLSWWMWDCDFGTKNTVVTYVDGKNVDVADFSVLYDEFFVDKVE